MKEHPPCPGVKHGDEPGLAAEVTRLLAKIVQRGGAFTKEERVKLLRMGLHQLPQRIGHGDGDQVIIDREQPALPARGPLLLLAGAAARTGAVIATVQQVKVLPVMPSSA
jgi:hypothetical protein